MITDKLTAAPRAERRANARPNLSAVATTLGTTATHMAVAWAMTKMRQFGLDAVTLVRARTRRQLGVALAARDLQLSDEAIAQIETAVPPGSVAGARYAPAAMVHLDSERPTPRP